VKRRNKIEELKTPLLEKSTKMDELVTSYRNDIAQNQKKIQVMERKIAKILQDRESLKLWIDKIETYSKEPSIKEISDNEYLQSCIEAIRLEIPCLREVSYKFVFGGKGSGNGQLKYPTAITTNIEGNIIVAEYGNHRIQVFDPDGQYLRKFGTRGSGDGRFYYVHGLAADSEGHIIIADESNNRIQVFNSEGGFLRKFGTQGHGDGQFASPHKVAVDRHRNIFVTDRTTLRVQMFNSQGEFLASFPTKFVPANLAVDSEGNIFISNPGNSLVHVLDSKGQLMMEFGPGHNPAFLTVDSEDNVIVSDITQAVHVYDPNGVFATKFVSEAGKFINGIAVNRKGNIFLMDHNNHAIRVLH